MYGPRQFRQKPVVDVKGDRKRSVEQISKDSHAGESVSNSVVFKMCFCCVVSDCLLGLFKESSEVGNASLNNFLFSSLTPQIGYTCKQILNNFKTK